VSANFKRARLGLLCGCAVAVASCAYRPPQTGFYCVDIPRGRSSEANEFVQNIADRLDFRISKAVFPGFNDNEPPQYVWDVYGRGVSLFVGNAMHDGDRDRFGNIKTTFNPHRLDLHVSKSSLFWQRIRFNEVLIAARDAARQRRWRFSKAAPGKSCAT
jgi:hypothetical protein